MKACDRCGKGANGDGTVGTVSVVVTRRVTNVTVKANGDEEEKNASKSENILSADLCPTCTPHVLAHLKRRGKAGDLMPKHDPNEEKLPPLAFRITTKEGEKATPEAAPTVAPTAAAAPTPAPAPAAPVAPVAPSAAKPAAKPAAAGK